MSSPDSPRASRRALLAAAVAALGTAACGFRLRGEATYAFASVFVSAPGLPSFGTELTRALEATGGIQVASSATGAHRRR